jgi:hypothetical protein
MADNAVEQRRIDNIGQQVDNASLQAGSPMYYYCRACGGPTAVLPEGWWKESPPKYCDACIKEGVPEDSYDDWLKARGEEPVPR